MRFPYKNNSWIKGTVLLTAATLASTTGAFAAGAPKTSEMNNPLALALVLIAAVLLLAIALLANVVIGAARVYVENLKKQKEEGTGAVVKVVSVLVFCLLSTCVFAQDEPVKQVVTTIGGMAKSSFYFLVAVIGFELLILMSLALFLKKLVAKEKEIAVAEVETPVAKEASFKKFWNKINSFKPVHEEADLQLDHDYDGIRELDNRLPPWWLYGFCVCILFACIYLYRYHVSHSAPSSHEEYVAEMMKAAEEKEEYLKKSANKVDENTVTLLTDAGALAEGKKIFSGSCAPCHGAEGQGVVGPNLTDDYWLYKGGVKDVFKTIKYGVPEKGMKSWKDDFSPVQIAQLSSYIKSLRGTKPAGAKEPQGELYTEGAATADSARLAAK